MPAATTPPDSDDETPERNRRLLLVLGVLGAVSAVVAGAVIFSSGAESTPPKDPQALARAEGLSLAVGRPGARAQVVVYEDFASSASRAFEIASRDFLRVEAAQGQVRVEYHPVTLTDDESTAAPLAAWETVLAQGTAQQALALHDLLFDRQPSHEGVAAADLVALAKEARVKDSDVLEAVGALDLTTALSTREAARAAGVRTTPTVLVDGEPVSAASPTALADVVQQLVLAADPS